MSIKPVDEARKKLWSLFNDHEEYIYRIQPERATFKGIHKYDDLLTDLSEKSLISIYNTTRQFLTQLLKIDYNLLSDDDKLNYDIFKHNAKSSLGSEPFKFHCTPLWQQDGIHINFPVMAAFQPCSNNEEAEKYFKRLEGFGKQVSDTIDNIRIGMKQNLVMPDFIIEQTLPQIENIYNTNAEDSIFYQKLKSNDDVSSSLRQKILITISSGVYSEFKRFYDFIKKEYLPKCRKDAGIWSMPDGNERYKYLIKDYTTLELTPDEIHETGLRETERITKEMEKVIEGLKFTGSMKEFNNYLRTDPSFFYSEKDDLMNGFRKILNKMDAKLPKLFGKLPAAGYDLTEMEDFRAASAPAAYYYPAPDDRTRPGYFYVNTYNLNARPVYGMTALALHEAVPGHHLQIALAQELSDLPTFRREWASATSYVEGWALYAESLGYETGMYEDPYQHYGALSNEIWRACRRVVDTGSHHKKWTREQSVDFMSAHTPNPEHDVRSEVDRYIAFPGQALAYKIGELKIKGLRRLAESSLNGRFTLKDFHDTILGSGALPLSYLEKIVNEWIEKEKQ